MLKTTRSSRLSSPKVFKAENDEVVGGDGRANKTVVDLSKLSKVEKSSKIQKLQRPKKSTKTLGLEKSNFFTANTKLAIAKMSLSQNSVQNSQNRTIGYCYNLQE